MDNIYILASAADISTKKNGLHTVCVGRRSNIQSSISLFYAEIKLEKKCLRNRHQVTIIHSFLLLILIKKLKKCSLCSL